MIEIVYISPTCRQAEDFIRTVWWKLKNIGIESYVIDRENINLKVRNFVISCVSLSGAKTGRYSFFAECYIDGVTNAEYGNEEKREYAIKKLEHFKRGFGPGTKEVSESELIKILTEETA